MVSARIRASLEASIQGTAGGLLGTPFVRASGAARLPDSRLETDRRRRWSVNGLLSATNKGRAMAARIPFAGGACLERRRPLCLLLLSETLLKRIRRSAQVAMEACHESTDLACPRRGGSRATLSAVSSRRRAPEASDDSRLPRRVSATSCRRSGWSSSCEPSGRHSRLSSASPGLRKRH